MPTRLPALRPTLLRTLLGCTAAALSMGAVAAQPQARPFNQPLDSTSQLPRTRFGSDVAVGARVAVIGAPGDSQRGPDAGSIHVYNRSAVTGAYDFLQQIQPPGLDPFDRFGDSIALSGDLLVVGAKGDDDSAPNAGAVYVFQRQGIGTAFQFIQKLVPPSATASDCFGYSVDVTANRIVVGAPRADLVSQDAGAVYTYIYDFALQTATPESVVTDPNGRAGDALGSSVAIAGSYLVTGVNRLDVPNGPFNTGGVIVYEEVTPGIWATAATLFASSPTVDSKFGDAIAFEPPRQGVTGVLIVGAPEATAVGDIRPRGSVTIFEADLGQPWAEVLTYGASEPWIEGELGTSVALQNGVALAGAPGRDEDRGSVDILRRDIGGWYRESTVEIPGTQEDDRAGAAVALQNSFPVIGAEGHDEPGADERGWAWSVSELWASLGEPYCSPGIPNSRGHAASLVARGSAVISDHNLILEAGLLPTFSFSYALVSPSTGFVAQPGTSQGNLCLGAPIGRYIDRPAQAQQAGRVEITIDLDFIPLPQAPVGSQPGDTWYFQLWYRDANPQVTSNFTDAIRVTAE